MLRHMKQRADLSVSSYRKLMMFDEIITNILDETSTNKKKMTPTMWMKILKYICEIRNKALQGTMLRCDKFKIKESYFIRDALADIRWIMRAIKRQMGGELTMEYKGCQLYYDQQKTNFGQLERIPNRMLDLIEPARLSFNQAIVLKSLRSVQDAGQREYWKIQMRKYKNMSKTTNIFSYKPRK